MKFSRKQSLKTRRIQQEVQKLSTHEYEQKYIFPYIITYIIISETSAGLIDTFQ